MSLNIYTRDLIITDVETTGLDHRVHEIIEIGAVRVAQPSLSIIGTFNLKIIPTFARAPITPQAQHVNGYRAEDWEDAVPLCEALDAYNRFAAKGMFTAHNVTFDWAFVETGFHECGLVSLLDYHRLDTLTLAWGALRGTGQVLGLASLCKFLGIPQEAEPHRALNGAQTVLQVLIKLRDYHSVQGQTLGF